MFDQQPVGSLTVVSIMFHSHQYPAPTQPLPHQDEFEIPGCERILRDEFQDYPESALYMIGAIEEAKGKTISSAKPRATPLAADAHES